MVGYGVPMCPSGNVSSYFTSSVLNVLFVLLQGFVRWVVSDRTAALFSGFISRIFTKRHAASLCRSHLALFWNAHISIKEEMIDRQLYKSISNSNRKFDKRKIVTIRNTSVLRRTIKESLWKRRRQTKLLLESVSQRSQLLMPLTLTAPCLYLYSLEDCHFR